MKAVENCCFYPTTIQKYHENSKKHVDFPNQCVLHLFPKLPLRRRSTFFFSLGTSQLYEMSMRCLEVEFATELWVVAGQNINDRT